MSEFINKNKYDNDAKEINADEFVVMDEICRDVYSDVLSDIDASDNDDISEVDEILNEFLSDSDVFSEKNEISNDTANDMPENTDDEFVVNSIDISKNQQEFIELESKNVDDNFIGEESFNKEFNNSEDFDDVISSKDDISINITAEKPENKQISFYEVDNIETTASSDKYEKQSADSIDQANTEFKSKTITLNLEKIQGKLEKQISRDDSLSSGRSFKYRLYKNADIFRDKSSCDRVPVVGEGFFETVDYELRKSFSNEELSREAYQKGQIKEYVPSDRYQGIKQRLKSNNLIKKILFNENKQEPILKNKSDIPKVKKHLLGKMRKSFFLSAINAVCILVLFVISVYFRLSPTTLQNNSLVYVLLSMMILSISCLACKDTIKDGLKGLVCIKKFDLNTSIAIAAIITFIQNIIAISNLEHFDQNGSVIFDLLVVLALFLDSSSKFLHDRRLFCNSNFLSSKRQLYTVDAYSDEKQAQKMFNGFGNYQAKIVYQREWDMDNCTLAPTVLTPIDKLCKKMALPSVLIYIAITVVYAFKTKELLASFTVLSLLSCVSFSVAGIFAVNWLLFDLSHRANLMGSMISGYSAVEDFSDTNAVLLDANTLYPKECVYLHKIKGLSSVSVDRVVLDVAAILIKANSPLAPIFYSVIKGKRDMLPYVDSVSYNDNLGIEAWSQGRRILIGNRFFMEDNCVSVGHMDDEEKYSREGKQVTYIAFSNELVCMLVTSYKPSSRMIREMQNLEDSGVNFLIMTTDPNITSKTVANNFRIFFRSVKILPKSSYNNFKSEVKHTKTRKSFASLVTNGTLASFAKVVSISVRLKSSATATAIVQAVCSVLSFFTAVFLVFHTGIVQLHLLEMFFYSLFWSGAVLLVSKLRN